MKLKKFEYEIKSFKFKFDITHILFKFIDGLEDS